MANKSKKRTDEEIITALLTCGSKKGAAEKLGIAESSIYNRMRDVKFQSLYTSAKADILRSVVTKIDNSLTEAISTIEAIMNDSNNNSAVRLQAAQTILNNAGKLGERLIRTEDKSTELVRYCHFE